MLHREIYFYTATIHQWKPLLKDFNLESVIVESLSLICHGLCPHKPLLISD